MDRSFRLATFLAVAACAAVGLAQPSSVTARLATVPIDSSLAASVTGRGSVSATLDGRILSVDGSFTGLAGPATAAYLHESPVTGVRGPEFAELAVDQATAGRITGRVGLSRAEAAALADGRIYVQIHSEAAPDGNLWGWLLP